MRELKFRVWDDFLNDWHATAATTEFMDKCNKGYNFNIVCFGNPGKVHIEQYTGLKDKNDREIYDGDIIQEEIDFNSTMTDGIFKYRVYWDEDELCWALDPIGKESIHNELWQTNLSRRVIGNIHEGEEEE